MSIAATHHNSQQRVTALDADVSQLAQDINRLSDMAHLVDSDDERQHFARLEHTVNWRLNQLAYVLATQDTIPLTRHQ